MVNAKAVLTQYLLIAYSLQNESLVPAFSYPQIWGRLKVTVTWLPTLRFGSAPQR